MFELHISLFVSSWCTTFRLLCSWLPEAWSRTCTCACTCACTSLICLNPPHHQRGGSDSCWRPASDQFEPGDIKRLSVQKRGGEKLHPHLHLSEVERSSTLASTCQSSEVERSSTLASTCQSSEVERSSTLASTCQRWREAPPSPPPVRVQRWREAPPSPPPFRGGEKLHPRLHLSEVERSSTLASTCQPRPDRCLCGEFWADPDFSGQL
ncbi:CCAAT/enhancer-binding protein gamma isoform X3 [Leuresthes tenuis]|uniref:CCAAT/enhancer-binding protein gamma isoform X3 n=1 Tax=Leuresthes tenuis TaxID=355514 RepID=UPI003B51341F